MLANQLLKHMEVPKHHGVFVLGVFEDRVTLFSQQVRALNLAYSLFCERRFGRGDRILIVGAGGAGLTFAAAAYQRGARVTLVEKGRRPQAIMWREPDDHSDLKVVDVFRRVLMPRMSEWPGPRWNEMNAGLPLLNWMEGCNNAKGSSQPAGLPADPAEVCDALWKAAYREFTQDPSRAQSDVRLFLHGTLLHLRSQSDAWEATFSGHSTKITRDLRTGSIPLAVQHHVEEFNLIVICVGFGEEAGENQYAPSYWTPVRKYSPAGKEVLVSGTGDGGLIDALCLSTGWSHATMVERATEWQKKLGTAWSAIRDELLHLEERALRESWPHTKLVQGYSQLRQGQMYAIDTLDTILDDDSSTRRASTVLLNSKDDGPLSIRSQPLHRLLVWRQLQREKIQFLRGSLCEPKLDDAKLAVALQIDEGVQATVHVDHVIKRHGSQRQQGAVEALLRAAQSSLSGLSGPDQTRSPIWPHGFFEARDGVTDTIHIENEHTQRHRIETLNVESMISPHQGTSDRDWVNLETTMTFSGVSVQKPGLYLDHEIRGVHRAKFDLREWDPTKIEVESGGVHSVPSTAVVYTIKAGVHEDPIIIKISGMPAGTTWCRDGVGFPIYGDLEINTLSLTAKIQGYVPQQPRVICIAIRRRDYSELNNPPVWQKTIEPATGNDGQTLVLTYTRQLPTPGYLYAIAWDSLTPLEKR